MNPNESTTRPGQTQRGFGLVETMVGLVIGLIAVLVIYQVFTVAEGFKRNTTAAGEAQSTGLFSTFLLGMELANSGTAMADSAADLATCPDTGNIATSFRPIPVLITDGGGGTANPNPDSFVVNYSIASTLTSTAMFNYKDPVAKTTTYGPGDAFNIQSAGGFHVGDLIVSINPALPDCRSSKITAVSATGFQTVDLYGTLTDVPTRRSRTQAPRFPTMATGARVCRCCSTWDPPTAHRRFSTALNNGVLYSTPLLDANGQPLVGPVGNPIASNVVMMKVEYGIDNEGDAQGLLATWVQANVGGGWDPATLLPAPLPTINQIKAIRIGIIVQSEQFDQTLGDYNWVLFDCNNVNKALCPGRLSGTIGASAAPPGNWRFRKYETIIPLRNVIWNKSPNLGTLSSPRVEALKSTQRGVVLFIALIVMVVMSLAAVALMRSVDTTTAVIGNLAFRQASILPANYAIEDAAAGLFDDANPAFIAADTGHNSRQRGAELLRDTQSGRRLG